MSDWSLQRWTKQLKSTDEPACHEAAYMLGQQDNADAVPALLSKSVPSGNYWHATDAKGEPVDPEYRPLIQTIETALKELGTKQVARAHADLKSRQAWKALPEDGRPAQPDWRNSPIAKLVTGLYKDQIGAFNPEASSRAAWVLGEVSAELTRWEPIVSRQIDWPALQKRNPSLWGPVTPNLMAFMSSRNFAGGAAAVAVLSALREMIGNELDSLLDAMVERRERGEPSDLSRVQEHLISSLGYIGHQASVKAIVKSFRPEWPDLHWEAVTALGLLKDTSTLVKLVTHLNSCKGALKARTARAIGMLGDKRATRYLIPLLNDDDPSIRTETARALGRLQDPRTRDRLFQSMLDEDETVRFAVGTALGMLGDARTVPFLLQAIEDGDVIVQREADAALDKLGKNALTSLVQLLRAGKPPYRAISAKRMGDLADPRSIRFLIPALLYEDCELEVADALAKIGNPAVLPLISYIENTDPDLENVTPELQEQAARVLGKIGDKRAANSLIATLSNSENEPKLREEAARVLGRLESQEAIGTLKDALENADRKSSQLLRAEAARALGKLKATAALDLLITSLKDERSTEDDNVRNHAIDAIGEIGDKRASPELITQLTGYRTHGRAGIIQALGKLQDSEAIPHLLEIAEEEPRTYLNSFAIRALSELGEPAIIPMILRERSYHQELPSALHKLGERALPPLLDQLNKGDLEYIRAIAALALGQLAQPATMGALIQALQDPSETVQKAAARSLARLHAAQ
jgi:HEAT repeat protein